MSLTKVLTSKVDTLRGLIRLAGIGLPAGQATITRKGERGIPDTIRGGLLDVSTAGFVVEDAEALFGQELTYRVVATPTSRALQTNLVLNPKFKYDTTNWTPGNGRTLTRRTSVPLPPRDAQSYVEISPLPTGQPSNPADRKLAMTSPSSFGPGTYFVSGQLRYDSPDLWLWDDAKTAGTWQTIKNKGTWQDVKAANSPQAGQPFASLWASVIGGSLVTTEQRRNLISNPSFEANVATGWTFAAGAGGTATAAVLASAGGLTGTGGYLYRGTWTVPTTFSAVPVSTGGFNYTVSGITPGTVYRASAYLRCSKAQLVAINYQFLDNVGGVLLQTTFNSTASLAANTATRVIGGGVTAPANTVSVKVFFTASPTSFGGTLWAAGDTFDIDGVLLESVINNASDAGYFSGNTPASGPTTYAWLGTPDLSQSTQSYTDYASVVAPFQIIGVQASDGGAWVTFQAQITIPAGAPTNCKLVFSQGTVLRELSVTWWLSTIMVSPISEITASSLVYFDGDSLVPANPAQNLAPGYDWQPLTGDASMTWNGTDNASVSVFTGPSQIFAEDTAYIGQPSEDQLPGMMIPIFLSDPVAPQLALWFDLVEIGDLTFAARAQLYDVLSRGPQIAVSQLRAWASGQFRLLTRTPGEASVAERLFGTGRILFLRNPDPRFPENGWWLHIGDVTSGRAGPGVGWSPERIWLVPFVRVERPEGLISSSSSVTWQDVKAGYANWDDERRRRTDWLDVALTGPST